MNLLAPALVAFGIATLLAMTEFQTSKYPNTGFLLWSSRHLWIYCILYGIIALAAFLISDWVIASSKLSIQGLGLQYPYVRAAILGISTKAIMQLNLYTVTAGSATFPIGFQTIVELFEPFLIRQISLKEFTAVKAFILPRVQRYTELSLVKTMAKQNIPAFLSQPERAALDNEIEKDQRIEEVMARFLRVLGRELFDSVFP